MADCAGGGLKRVPKTPVVLLASDDIDDDGGGRKRLPRWAVACTLGAGDELALVVATSQSRALIERTESVDFVQEEETTSLDRRCSFQSDWSGDKSFTSGHPDTSNSCN